MNILKIGISSGVIICLIICVSLIVMMAISERRKCKSGPYRNYRLVVTNSHLFTTTLSELNKQQADIVQITPDFLQPNGDIIYMIIYREGNNDQC